MIELMKQVMIVVFFCVAVLNFSCQKKTKTVSLDARSTYPTWVKQAVFYQIFPDRYRNGDPSNDPQIPDLKGSWPHIEVTDWQVHPWTSDWYKLQPWEEKNERGFADNAQLRRYGGDFQGIIDKLDYIADLGITAIYLNPVFESPSLHKYDATYYHHIDDNFGPNPQKDREIIATEDFNDPDTWQWTTADRLFLEFLGKAHKRNIRVIIDGVFNHVGYTFWAFNDVHKNGEKSPYKDWFVIKKYNDPATEEDEFDYEGWFGARELPVIREDSLGLVTGPKEHIFAVVNRCMDPNGDGDPSDGIDGWRLDVAEMVSHEFWKDFRVHVKSINPQAYITAELFWDDWKNEKLMDPSPWLQGDQFDATMNYRWSHALASFFIDKKTRRSATEFAAYLKKIWSTIPEENNYVLLNLMDSHDTDRLASNVINPDRFYDKYISWWDEGYDIRKPNEQEMEVIRLIVLYQMTSAGAPMIYYGGETGMWGADDPCERKPMVWPDLTYETEIASPPNNKTRPADPVDFDHDLFNYYKKLVRIRHDHPILSEGSWKFIVTDDQKDVIVIQRTLEDDHCYLVFNNSDTQQSVTLSPVASAYKNVLNGDVHEASGKVLDILIAKKSGVILIPED
jgi:glycosidase